MGSDFCLLYIKEPDEAHASSGLLTSVRTVMLHIEVLRACRALVDFLFLQQKITLPHSVPAL